MGSITRNVAPGPAWRSMIERLIDSPMPIPPRFMVKTSVIRHVARSPAIGNVKRKIAPCGTFGDAQSLPP